MNVKRIFDEYNSEDYLCHKLKPRGLTRCGYCHEVWEPTTSHEFDSGDEEDSFVVCKHCGEVSFPYEED